MTYCTTDFAISSSNSDIINNHAQSLRHDEAVLLSRLSAGLVIARLRNLGLTPDTVACLCVLKAIFHLGAKQSNRCGGPA